MLQTTVQQTYLVSCGGCAPRVCPPTIGGNVQETEGLQTELPDPVSQILSITLQQSGSYIERYLVLLGNYKFGRNHYSKT